MLIVFLCITFNSILVSGSSLSDKVYMSPADIIKQPEETATIECSHSIDSYDQILWYKQTKDGQLQFLGYMYQDNKNPEPSIVDVKMDGNAVKDKTCTLTVEGLSQKSSAVYFCAARLDQQEAYFGQGTKLTVLENGLEITRPTVKVLQPSPKECRNDKDDAKKKTIVCVASGFYPDHVGVFWDIDGENVTAGVATDEAALREGNSYTITSRLRVSVKDWFTPTKRFTCTVSFYNGTHTELYSNSIKGKEAKGEAMTREKYLKITQSAKLSYAVFIAKSSIYGAFVAFLVWKLQSSSGKQNN